MSKNLIFIVNVNRERFLQYSRPTVEKYCEKHNVDLKIIGTKKYNLPVTHDYNYNIFEKYQVYDYINGYERILRLDADVIIAPHCPNYFDSDPEPIYVTYEDVRNRREQRLAEIQRIQGALGNVPNWKKGYFNSGVVLFSARHKEAFKFDRSILRKALGAFKEQSSLNWNVRNCGFKVKDLGCDFNYLSLFEEGPSGGVRV